MINDDNDDRARVQIEIDIQPQSGPVVTRVEYRVADADVVPFVRGMLVLRQIRQQLKVSFIPKNYSSLLTK